MATTEQELEFWKLKYKHLKEAAQEVLNKIHYTDDLYAVFNIKDCEQVKNLREEVNKLK